MTSFYDVTIIICGHFPHFFLVSFPISVHVLLLLVIMHMNKEVIATYKQRNIVALGGKEMYSRKKKKMHVGSGSFASLTTPSNMMFCSTTTLQLVNEDSARLWKWMCVLCGFSLRLSLCFVYNSPLAFYHHFSAWKPLHVVFPTFAVHQLLHWFLRRFEEMKALGLFWLDSFAQNHHIWKAKSTSAISHRFFFTSEITLQADQTMPRQL